MAALKKEFYESGSIESNNFPQTPLSCEDDVNLFRVKGKTIKYINLIEYNVNFIIIVELALVAYKLKILDN